MFVVSERIVIIYRASECLEIVSFILMGEERHCESKVYLSREHNTRTNYSALIRMVWMSFPDN